MSAEPTGTTLNVEGLAVRYGKRTALEGVSFSVPAGSVYALLGRNGAGKSSLVRCALGQQKPDAGLAPSAGPGWNQEQTQPAGSPGTHLFVGEHGELVRLDPETGRREAVRVPPIPGGGKPQW